MADILLSERGDTTPLPKIGKNWVSSFLKRNKDLKSKYLRRYNYQRAKCEDPKVIGEFFDAFQKAIIDYGIVDDDIYNFDETGFAMGIIATAKVVTLTANIGRPVLLQPGNCEWVISIEAVNTIGWLILLMIIFAGKTYIGSWFKLTETPCDWRIQISSNGWTIDEIGMEWLTKYFELHIRHCMVGKYCMLVLDRHGSHLMP
jgi:hypothetical protein